jgi:hypothetical protein
VRSIGFLICQDGIIEIALFWVPTQFLTDVLGQPIDPILKIKESKIKNPEDGTDRLHRNVGKKLPLLAA